MKYAVIAALCLLCLVPIITMFKKGSFLKSLFISAFQGIISLLAVNALGLLTGVTIALNAYTAAAAVIFGLPGCIAMLAFNIIL